MSAKQEKPGKEQPKKDQIKVVASNRKARHDYEILETHEAGIALVGSEVKSLRDGKATLKDSYAVASDNGVVLFNTHISPYEKTGYAGHEPERPRRLLLHHREINKLISLTAEKGLTLIPLRLYFKGKFAKVELAVCRGKRQYDKRAAVVEREMARDIEREIKRRR
jgi:SsrA-binding protein